MNSRPSKERWSVSLPPWLWFWLIVYLFSLPDQLKFWQQHLNDLFFHQDLPAETTGTSLAFLLRLANIAELVPLLALFLGVLSIFLPWVRAAYLERRFNLSNLSPASPALQEMTGFLAQHAPGILIKSNWLRTDQIAFVYPCGYRKTAIALFGGLAKLWRSDRPATEAVLLHEVAHYRHGDALIVGAGSFFEIVVKRWMTIYFFLCLLPFTLVIAEQSVTAFREGKALGIPFSTLLFHTFGKLRFLLPGIVLQWAGLLFWSASIFIAPLLADWSAELNADRFAVDVKKSSDALIHALEKLPRRTTWWRWFLLRISHPPNRMRRWLAAHFDGLTGLIFLLLLFPGAYLVRLLVLSGRAMTGYLMFSYGISDIVKAMSDNVAIYMKTMAPKWGFMAALLLFWPFLAEYWEWWFCGKRESANWLNYKGYFLSAAIMGGVTIYSFCI